MQTVPEFLDYFDKIHDRTLRVAKCIPPDKIEWTWSEGNFTLGDLVRHIAAIERFMYAENVQQKPSRYPGHGRELANGYDEVIAFFNRAHEESMQNFRTLTEEDMNGKCVTPGEASIRTWKWLRAMTEHEVHHRGQIYMYLALLGVDTPPLYGLTSEEVRSRSL